MSDKVTTTVYRIDPAPQGAPGLAVCVEPPDGYEFVMMERNGSLVLVTFKEKK